MKRLIVILLLVTPLAADWKLETKMLRGEKVVRNKKTYYVISAQRPAVLTLAKDHSLRLMVSNPGGANALIIDQGKNRFKEVPVGPKETIDLILKKDTYSLTSQKDFCYLRLYRWQASRLAPVQPVGGGFPLTLLVRDKKAAYFNAAKDKNLKFKVTGPAPFYVYARPVFPKTGKPGAPAEFVLKIVEGDKEILSKSFKATPSKAATFLEQKDIVPGISIKLKVDLTPGLHELKVYFDKGQGFVRGYIHAKPQKKPTRPPAKAARNAGGFRTDPVVALCRI